MPTAKPPRTTLAWTASTCLLLAATAAMQAQEQQLPEYTGKGKIEDLDVAKGLIQFKDADEQPVLVKVLQTTKLTVVGTAEPGFLTKGHFVRFSTKFNKKGLAEGEVGELSVVELSEVLQPGIYPDQIPGEDQEPEDLTYLVVGQVASAKANNLQVIAPNSEGEKAKLRVKLAEDAKIDVDLTDGRLVKAGDEIEVYGKLYQPGQVIGSKVDITLVEPLTGKKKRPARVKKGDEKKGKDKNGVETRPAADSLKGHKPGVAEDAPKADKASP